MLDKLRLYLAARKLRKYRRALVLRDGLTADQYERACNILGIDPDVYLGADYLKRATMQLNAVRVTTERAREFMSIVYVERSIPPLEVFTRDALVEQLAVAVAFFLISYDLSLRSQRLRRDLSFKESRDFRRSLRRAASASTPLG